MAKSSSNRIPAYYSKACAGCGAHVKRDDGAFMSTYGPSGWRHESWHYECRRNTR